MREIEVKIKIEDREVVLERLRELGADLSEEIYQHDEVFTNEEFEKNRGCVRIRTQQDTVFFTYKRSASKENELDSIEKELTFEDPETMRDILFLSGFETYSIVEKKRIKAKINEYEICVDRVTDLGDFVEVESVVHEDEKADHVESEILEFIEKTLKQDISKRVFKGYDNLILELKNYN